MKKILLSSMSLQEKIAQMIIVCGRKFDQRYVSLGVGGIFLEKLNSKEEYKRIISKYQENSKIKLFVSADVEGYQNPFKNFHQCKKFGDIKNQDEAYKLGVKQGVIMNELGFNLNFSPVVEMIDTIWPGRSFKGSLNEIKGKIGAYIRGLHEQGILATAKHYPGGSMIKDPHENKYKTQINEDELKLFDESIKLGVEAIMIGHPIVYGLLNSKNKPCTISPEIIFFLRNKFDKLIITDSIAMKGLTEFYPSNFDEKIYADLIKAGNDIILESSSLSSYEKVKKRIDKLLKKINKGEFPEKRINESIKRILVMKGYMVD